LGTLLWRWNFALALAANQVPSVNVPARELVEAIGGSSPAKLLPHFIGRAGTTTELKALDLYVTNQGLETNERKAELLGLILASPAFQRY
jgi:hypothetical protein